TASSSGERDELMTIDVYREGIRVLSATIRGSTTAPVIVFRHPFTLSVAKDGTDPQHAYAITGTGIFKPNRSELVFIQANTDVATAFEWKRKTLATSLGE